MGIRERHERDREAIQRAILDAARELFVSEGYQNVSIRKIAERIEYSPAAIYGYFRSKDDIFFALAEEGFRLLSSVCEPMWKSDRNAMRKGRENRGQPAMAMACRRTACGCARVNGARNPFRPSGSA